MRSVYFIPVAALALAVACSENSPNPVESNGGNHPQFAGGSGSPHFIANATSCTETGSPTFTLSCDFKEAGLSAGAIEQITLAVTNITANYGCVNGGEKVPSDVKKSFNGPVSTTTQFGPVPKNGNLIGTITLSPPAASTVLSCPPGQTATLISADFSGTASLTDNTSGAFIGGLSF